MSDAHGDVEEAEGLVPRCVLDAALGLTAHVIERNGARCVEFRVVCFRMRLGVEGARKLVSVLEAWLREHGEGVDPQDRRPEG